MEVQCRDLLFSINYSQVARLANMPLLANTELQLFPGQMWTKPLMLFLKILAWFYRNICTLPLHSMIELYNSILPIQSATVLYIVAVLSPRIFWNTPIPSSSPALLTEAFNFLTRIQVCFTVYNIHSFYMPGQHIGI